MCHLSVRTERRILTANIGVWHSSGGVAVLWSEVKYWSKIFAIGRRRPDRREVVMNRQKWRYLAWWWWMASRGYCCWLRANHPAVSEARVFSRLDRSGNQCRCLLLFPDSRGCLANWNSLEILLSHLSEFWLECLLRYDGELLNAENWDSEHSMEGEIVW